MTNARKDTGIVNIHGREYKTVALRVSEFREAHPDWSLTTEVLEAGDPVIVRATIADDSGRILATGHAEEARTARGINSTSALENAETSAIGRALAALGFAGSEFASADEVAGAIKAQERGEGTALAARRKQVQARVMEAFGRDVEAIRAWLSERGFGSVKLADMDELARIEAALGPAKEAA